MQSSKNDKFQFTGINHVALVCSDMERTVRFYRDVLGMPLVKTLDLPNGSGQHFFFGLDNGDSVAFFWYRDALDAAPGIAAPSVLPRQGKFRSAHGSMSHLALNVPLERFEEYCDRLTAAGIEINIIDHDTSPSQCATEYHDGVFIRSAYFLDPDSICLEIAAWTRPLAAEDVSSDPVRADGTRAAGVVVSPSMANA